MNKFNILIDTNVIIGLEDAQPVHASFAELVRLTGAYNVGLFVESANFDDVARDRDLSRREITLSKLATFQRLAELQIPSAAELASRFGPIRNRNDLSDVRLLYAVDAKAVDFLITQDIGIHRRALRAEIGSSVLTIEDALGWLRSTFQDKPVDLPNVVERKAYQIDRRDSIFVSLQQDYDGFSEWFEKCRRQHRDCWVLDVGGEIAGLVIRKDETHEEAQTQFFAHKILKICTFKVRDEFRGEKFGELLLKQILWFAQRNKYGLVYLTAFPKQTFLRDLLQYFGFEETRTLPSGELMLEKTMLHGQLPAAVSDCFSFSRKNYPRFFDGSPAKKILRANYAELSSQAISRNRVRSRVATFS